MEWIETERGGKKLLLDGYIYVKKKNLADWWESYECEFRRNRHECKARIKVKVSGDNEFRERTEHNHPPDHGKANAYKMKAAMKRMALETDESPQQILMATMHQATEEGIMAMPELNNIRRCIRRQRQDSREALTMDRLVEDLEDREGHRSVVAGEGLVARPGLSNIWRSIRRQHQDIQEAVALRRAEEDLDVLESHRPAAEEGLMALPVCRGIKRQHEDIRERRNGNLLEVSGGQISRTTASLEEGCGEV